MVKVTMPHLDHAGNAKLEDSQNKEHEGIVFQSSLTLLVQFFLILGMILEVSWHKAFNSNIMSFANPIDYVTIPFQYQRNLILCVILSAFFSIIFSIFYENFKSCFKIQEQGQWVISSSFTIIFLFLGIYLIQYDLHRANIVNKSAEKIAENSNVVRVTFKNDDIKKSGCNNNDHLFINVSIISGYVFLYCKVDQHTYAVPVNNITSFIRSPVSNNHRKFGS